MSINTIRMNVQSQSNLATGSRAEGTAALPEIDLLEMTASFHGEKRKNKKRKVQLQRILGIDADAGSEAVNPNPVQSQPSPGSSSDSEDGTDATEDEEAGDEVADQVWNPVNPEYKMSFPERGKAIIFNHTIFTDKRLKRREGSDKDQKELETTLGHLGFAVTVYRNLSRRQLLRCLQKISTEDHTDRDCLVIAVLSHGTKDEIHAQDEKYKREELWEPFTADSCPSLATKPKIFIIQACRGAKYDKGTIVNKYTQMDVGFTAPGGESFLIPNQSDFIFLHSSFKDYTSLLSKHGSPFIATLCRVLREDGENEDLLSLSTVVNLRMTKNFKCTSLKEDLKDRKQCPVVESSLTRKIYFRTKAGRGTIGSNKYIIREQPLR